MKIINNWSGNTYHAVQLDCTNDELNGITAWCNDTFGVNKGGKIWSWYCNDYTAFNNKQIRPQAVFYFSDQSRRDWFILRWS